MNLLSSMAVTTVVVTGAQLTQMRKPSARTLAGLAVTTIALSAISDTGPNGRNIAAGLATVILVTSLLTSGATLAASLTRGLGNN